MKRCAGKNLATSAEEQEVKGKRRQEEGEDAGAQIHAPEENQEKEHQPLLLHQPNFLFFFFEIRANVYLLLLS